jgi:excisionase family DNA binding protein
MEYMSTAEASRTWGVSPRQVQRLLASKRIPHAQKHGRSWLIPVDAEKPMDLRKEKNLSQKSLDAELLYVYSSTALPMPSHNPDSILDAMPEDRLRLIYEGELAYLRGDFERTIDCYREAQGDAALKLRSCFAGIMAAISAGDSRTYAEIEDYLKNCAKTGQGHVSAFAEMCLAAVAVSVIAPSMVPDWLKRGDLSALKAFARPNCLYLRAKYFSCMGNYEATLGVAETALAFCSWRVFGRVR